MKIAFIGGRDIHKLGGIENYMYNLATELVKLGHEPVVYCESERNGIEIINGFKVIYQKNIGGRFFCKILLAFKATITSIINRDGFDVYHYNAWPPSLASWIPRLIGKKTILQGHGFEWKRTKYSPFQQHIMKLMEYITAHTNTNITMVSQEQTDYFLEHYKKKCVTIPTAIQLPSGNIKSDILSKYSLSEQSYFLYLGRLVQDKNPDYLIKAYIKAKIQDIKLVIAGDNDMCPDYVNHLHELAKQNDNIIFTGAVYGNDKKKLLESCFAFCIPSTIEGLAITLLEAMSYHKIVIASNIAANKEGLGDSGVWCKYEDVDDLSDKLQYVVYNIKKLKWQEQANFDRVKTYFQWPQIAAKYDVFLHSLK